MQEIIAHYQSVAADLERLLPVHPKHNSEGQQSFLEMLPSTLRNNQDYMMQVAAKLSRLQDQLAELKLKFLEARQRVSAWNSRRNAIEPRNGLGFELDTMDKHIQLWLQSHFC